jgi:ADP-heptose:LPS heptosyltransferase
VLKGDHHVRLIRNHPGWRPYVVYASDQYRGGIANQTADLTVTNKARWVFHPHWTATPGELFVPRIEQQNYVVIEPHGKAGLSGNKNWPWKRWQELAHILLLKDRDVVQLGPVGQRILDDVRHIPTPTFESACTALSGASGAILPEGGLHHAAAALGVPAVVLFGGATSPRNTGYDCHVNIADDDPASPCGQRQPCAHCRDAWRRLTPEMVMGASIIE